jgi:hypothetical protein
MLLRIGDGNDMDFTWESGMPNFSTPFLFLSVYKRVLQRSEAVFQTIVKDLKSSCKWLQ